MHGHTNARAIIVKGGGFLPKRLTLIRRIPVVVCKATRLLAKLYFPLLAIKVQTVIPNRDALKDRTTALHAAAERQVWSADGFRSRAASRRTTA